MVFDEFSSIAALKSGIFENLLFLNLDFSKTTEPIRNFWMFWKAEIEHFQENRLRAFAVVFVDIVTLAQDGDFLKICILSPI